LLRSARKDLGWGYFRNKLPCPHRQESSPASLNSQPESPLSHWNFLFGSFVALYPLQLIVTLAMERLNRKYQQKQGGRVPEGFEGFMDEKKVKQTIIPIPPWWKGSTGLENRRINVLWNSSLSARRD
jgi:hypothetical protein